VSGNVAHKKRLITVNAANLRHKHLYIRNHLDFFPKDSFGGSTNGRRAGKPVTLHVDGLAEPIITDIPSDAKTGRPRAFFRKRAWVGRFFEVAGIHEGDVIAIERLSPHAYRIYPFENKGRSHNGTKWAWTDPPGKGPTVIELFAGCGGTALGFKWAGFRTQMAVEWDPEACETFSRNISERIAQSSIQEIDDFPHADVVAGGPPCQGFSNLGERVPSDPRNQLWRQFMRAVECVRPAVFVMENVPPLMRSQEYVLLTEIAKRLGYAVEGRVLNAADYGAPQLRRRAFVIGSRLGTPPWPKQTHRNPDEAPRFETASLPPWLTVRDAIADLPRKPDDKNWHIGRNPTPKSLKRYACIPEGGNRWNLPPDLMPDCWKRKTKGGTDLFGRLWWVRPSVTIRTEFYKPEKGRYLHPKENRPITHREAARLQGFPDDFQFCGRRISVGVQIGNAVPPPLARAVALAVRQHITAASRRAVGVRPVAAHAISKG
jgi:DNA (cytosine-5)-methyltransferase 1